MYQKKREFTNEDDERMSIYSLNIVGNPKGNL